MTSDVEATATPARDGRRALGVAADAIGHCVLVFAFVPILAVLPNWLRLELGDPVARAPMAVVFLPVRLVVTLLQAFTDGVGPRVVVGLVAGGLLWSWLAFGARDVRTLAAVGAGILCGLAAAGVVMLAALAQGQSGTLAASPVLQHLGTAALCGAIAAPTAARLVRTPRPAS